MKETIPLFAEDELDSGTLTQMKIAFSDGVTFKTVDDAQNLFDGFASMKAITWSYGLGMVVKQMRKFKHVELVFGCSNLLEREVKLSSLAPIVQQAETIKELQGKLGREISARVEDGSCELYFENTISSHQKLYLLADEKKGRYRVIAGSANLSNSAWSGDRQKEVVACFEGKEAYEEFLVNQYEPFKRTCTTHVSDLKAILDHVDDAGFPTIEDIPMMSPKNGVVVIEESSDAEMRVSMKDCALYGGLDREGVAALESAMPSVKGRIMLDSGSIETLKLEGKRIEEARIEEMAVCPKLVVGGDGSVSLNGKALTADGFEQDARTYVEFIENFAIFTGNVKDWQADAWKISCWYFATPFFPRLRRACRRARQDGRLSSLPMYLVLFGTSNAGKTALMRFLAKAMCGEDIRLLTGGAFKAGRAVNKPTASTIRKPRLMQVNQQGLPVLYDDVPSSKLNESSLRELLIDSLDEEYDESYPNYPAIVATSNVTPAMPREFRKRALFFESGASLPRIEGIKSGHIPSNLTEKMGSAMFAEYSSRMAPIIDEMCSGGNVDSLDVYKASSSTLMQILEEAGDRPDWATELTNENYFGEEAECRRAVDALVDYFRAHPGGFERNKRENRLFVHYEAADRNGEKLLKEVSNSLPPRCEPKLITGMLTLNLRETEDICKRKFKQRQSFLNWLLQ